MVVEGQVVMYFSHSTNNFGGDDDLEDQGIFQRKNLGLFVSACVIPF
jgi:hypothetical protein